MGAQMDEPTAVEPAAYFRRLCEAMKAAGYTSFVVQETIFPEIIVREEIRVDAGPYDGWPAIWDVVEKAGITWGCGGTYHHQYKTRKMPGFSGRYVLTDGNFVRKG